MKSLPQTGTSALLEALDPHLDDDFVSGLFPPRRTQGRHSSFSPAQIVFGTVPVNSSTAKRLLRQVRSWIEASQSYEKNQLGLGKMYLNGLRFCWTMALLADTVCLLRAHALLKSPADKPLLANLIPEQLALGFGLFPQNSNERKPQ